MSACCKDVDACTATVFGAWWVQGNNSGGVGHAANSHYGTRKLVESCYRLESMAMALDMLTQHSFPQHKFLATPDS
jgi:hypothetical protein